MMYYSFILFSILLCISFLITFIFALLRTVVNQEYPPFTKAYFSAEIVEALCLTFVIGFSPLGWWASKITRTKKYQHRGFDIVIVPGYEMNRWSSIFLQKYLEARGHRVWAINNIFFAKNLGEIIDSTEKKIFEICRQNEISEPIHLIGHSMGGVIACELGKRKKNNIGSIITMGTPFLGTKIHMLGIKNHVHDLSEKSEYCLEERNIDMPHLCFWSPIDSVVLPSVHSRLPHLNNKEVSVGHISFLFSTEVFHHTNGFYRSLQSNADFTLAKKE
jgi:hypothetical protein